MITALFGALVLALTVACGNADRVPRPSVPTPIPTPSAVTVIAKASVLITPEEERRTPTIESIRITPPAVILDPGETIQLSAEAFDADGRPITEVEFSWASADPRVGTIARSGLFHAGSALGVSESTVSVIGLHNTPDGINHASAFASITIVGDVGVPKLASLSIVPQAPTLLKQQIYRLRAMGFDEDGLVIPGISFVWRLNDPKLGRLNDLGYLTVEGLVGTYYEGVSVTGLWEGVRISASTDIRVVSAPRADDYLDVHALPQRFFMDPGDRLQLRAVALNGLGEVVAGTQLRWSMEDPIAGTVDGSGNFIAGNTPGVFTEAVKVEAMVPGERGFVRAADFASVVIRAPEPPGCLSSVFVEPASPVLAPNGRMMLAVRMVDEAGKPAKGVTISWELLNEQAGVLSPDGGFRAGKIPGIYPQALRAEIEQSLGEETISISKTVDIIVIGELATAKVHPALTVVIPGRTVHFSLTGLDQNGIALAGLVVLWSVADDAIGTIDAFGNFTAGKVPGLYEEVIVAEVVQLSTD